MEYIKNMKENPFTAYDWSGIRIKNVHLARSVQTDKINERFADRGYCQLAYKLTGKTDIWYGGDYIPYYADTILYLPDEKRENISYNKCFPEAGEAVCIFFFSEKPLYEYPFLLSANSAAAEPFRRLLYAYRRRSAETQTQSVEMLAILYEILASLDKVFESRFNVPETQKPYADSRLRRAETYMREHFTEPYIPLSVLAELAGTTEEYFRHRFRAVYGVPPLRYINDLRLTCARELLTQSTLSVSAVAASSGFTEPNYFSRFFRARTGFSPEEYRAMFLGGNK